jgi:uncharacterized cupredoxin-like copper-binding protein
VRKQFIALALLAFSASASTAGSGVEGQILDPAVHALKRLEPLTFGSEQDNTHMQPTEYRLKVGHGYRWKIIATPGAEYAFVAPAFLRNVWIRKVEVGEVEIKSATLDELEFENGGEAEIFFVAIRPGTYEFGSRGLMERGVSGKIVVESTDAPRADVPKSAASEKGAAEADEDHAGEAKSE